MKTGRHLILCFCYNGNSAERGISDGVKQRYLQKLLDWKKRSSHKVLELGGEGQVGKTYILNKFAQENCKTYQCSI